MLYRNTGSKHLRAALGALPRFGWVVSAVLLGVAALLTVTQEFPLVPALSTTAAMFLLIFPWFLFGYSECYERLPEPGRFAPAVVLLLLVPYLIYWAGTGGASLRGLITLTVYLTGAALLASGVDDQTSGWLLAAALFLWMPFDMQWDALTFLPWEIPWTGERIMAGFWNWPNEILGYPLSALVAADAALLLFGWARPIELKFNWEFTRRRLQIFLGLLALVSVVLVPVGHWIDFLEFGLDEVFFMDPAVGLSRALLKLLAIILFIAVPEELIFRGVVQNWLQELADGVSGEWIALFAASLIFGAAHLNNTVHGYTPPNFAFMGMATVAGVAYGYAWMRGGLFTAVLLHTAVDWIWVLFLEGKPS